MQSSRSNSPAAIIFLLIAAFLLSAILSCSPHSKPAASQSTQPVSLLATATHTPTSSPTFGSSPISTPSTSLNSESNHLWPILTDIIPYSHFPAVNSSPDGSVIGMISYTKDIARFQWFNAQTMQELGSFERPINKEYQSFFPSNILISSDNTKAILGIFDQMDTYILDLNPNNSDGASEISSSMAVYQSHFIFANNSKFYASRISGLDKFEQNLRIHSLGEYSLDTIGDQRLVGDAPDFPHVYYFQIYDITISADNRYVAAGTSNGIAILWDLSVGEIQKIFHPSSVETVAFSSNSKLLATGCADGLVRIWDLPSGQLQRTLNGFANSISGLRFSTDDSKLIAKVANLPDQIIDLNSGNVQNISEPTFSPEPLYIDFFKNGLYKETSWPGKPFQINGNQLYSFDKDIQVWDINSKKVNNVLVNPYADYSKSIYGGIENIIISPDGNYVAVVLDNEQDFLIQSTVNGETLQVYSVDYSNTFLTSYSSNFIPQFSPDSQTIAFQRDQQIEIHKVLDGSLVNTIPLRKPAGDYKFSFSEDGKKIYTILDRVWEIRIWDVLSAEQIESYTFPAMEDMPYIQYTLIKSHYWFFNLRTNNNQQQEMKIFDLEKKTFVNFGSDNGNITWEFDLDGNLLASIVDHSVRFWRLDTRALLYEMKNADASDIDIQIDEMVLDTGTSAEIWDIHAISEAARKSSQEIAILPPALQSTPVSQATPEPEKVEPLITDLGNLPRQTEQARLGGGVVNEVRWIEGGQSLLVSSPLGVDRFTLDLTLFERTETDGRVYSSALDAKGDMLVAEMVGDRVIVKRSDDITLLELQDYSHPVFSLDGSNVVCVNPAQNLEVWSLESGQKTALLHTGQEYSFTDNEIFDVAAQFSPDGRYVAAVLKDGVMRIWDARDGGIINAPGVFGQPVKQFAFSPDGRYITTSIPGSAWVFPVQPGEAAQESRFFENTSENQFPQPEYLNEVTSTALSPDNQVLAVGTTLHEITLFNRRSQEEIRKLTGIPSFSSQILFSPDGKKLLALDRDGNVLIWDANSGELLVTNQEHTASISGMFFNSEGELLAWENNTAWVIQPQTAEAQQTFIVPQGTVSAFSPNKQWLAIYEPYSVSIWDTQNEKLIHTMTEEFSTIFVNAEGVNKRGFGGSVFSPDNLFFAAAGTGNLWVYDTSDWQVKRSDGTMGKYCQPAFSAQSDMLYALLDTIYYTYLNVFGLKGNHIPLIPDYSFIVDQISLSPDGKLNSDAFYAYDHLGKLIISDIGTGETAKEYFFQYGLQLTASAFSPDGQTVAVGQEDGVIYLLNLQTDQVEAQLTGHRGAITHLAFAPDGRTLASGSEDGTIRFWTMP